jgi:hypothetical protein
MKRVIVLLFAGVFSGFSPAVSAQSEVAPGVLLLGRIGHPDIVESSGIVPARRMRDVFWTHNDSGTDMLYAMTADGQPLGEWKLKDTELQNWEDLAAAPGGLYIADIGNNDGSRDELFVYRFPEPNPRRPGELSPRRVWRLEYPNGDEFDAESFFVSRGAGYLIAKELSGGEAQVYRFSLRSRKGRAVELEPQCRLDVDAPVGGADLTGDKRRLAVITREGAYLFHFSDRRIPSDGKIEPVLSVSYSLDQMEGCAFTPEGLIVTAESGEILLFTDPLFQFGRRRR